MKYSRGSFYLIKFLLNFKWWGVGRYTGIQKAKITDFDTKRETSIPFHRFKILA